MEESTSRPVSDEITVAVWQAAQRHLHNGSQPGFGKVEGEDWFAQIRQIDSVLVIEANRHDIPTQVSFTAFGFSGRVSDDTSLLPEFVDWFTAGSVRPLAFAS